MSNFVGTVAKFSQDFDLRDKIFGFLKTIKGAEVVLILTEDNPKRTRVNLRSQVKVDVALLACRFSGGGHSRASGCLVETDMRGAKQRILRIKKVM